MEWLEGKKEGNWSDKRVKWKGHERKIRKKMRRTEGEITGTSEGHEKNKRKGGKLNKVNVKQRYDWRKWKEHGRNIETHERNVNRNEREMARTRKEMLLYVCICFFSIFTHIECDHHGDHGHAFRIFYLWGFWTWHVGTMKGYEQIMEGHGSNAHERKVEGNEMH